MIELKTRLSGFINFFKKSDLPNDKGAVIGHYCGQELAEALGFKEIPLKLYCKETESDFSNVVFTDINYISFKGIRYIIYKFMCLLRNGGIITLVHFKQEDKFVDIDGKSVSWNNYSSSILLPMIYEDSYVCVYKCRIFPEEFNCIQCGNCCKNLLGGYCFFPTTRDIHRWVTAQREDILAYCKYNSNYGWEAWIDPVEGVNVLQCPWMEQVGNRYICTIHEIKPDHCKIWYPISARTAQRARCKAWEWSPWEEQRIIEL